MLKYKQNGIFMGVNHEPHRRFVWLSKDMRNLCWSKPEEQEEGKGVQVYILPLYTTTTSNDDAIGISSFIA